MENTEQTIEKFHPHFVGFLKFYVIAILFFIFGILFYWPVIFLAVLLIFFGEIARRAETFYILDNGVAREYKMLSTSRKFAEYSKIQNIEVNQSFVQNIFHIGNVKFDTAGTDLIEVSFSDVKDPYEIEKIVRERMAVK